MGKKSVWEQGVSEEERVEETRRRGRRMKKGKGKDRG